MGFGTGGGAGAGRGKFSGKKCRLISMFCLTSVFFLLEIVTGYVTNSMALVADSFHMLSDIAALVIAFISVRMAPKSWSKNTFGWARAEVLGALVNAVFLVALCFSITVESMKRFYEPEEIHNPVMILYVGGMGLAVNLVGLCLFHEHGSSHGHSHGLTRAGEAHGQSHSASNMNMRGVFLHVMADALGSVVVIISAIIMWQTDWEYKLYVDPGLSLLLVILILRSVWPLLIDSALILLQTVPTHIQVDTLQRKLMEKVDGILAVHEFHVWQLTGDRIIASAHIRCLNLAQYMEVAEKVKEFFHHEGIHSTTIQPEFIETAPHNRLASTEDCVLACPKLPKNSFAGCEASKCCPPGSKAPSAGGQSRSSRSSSPLNRRPSSISISAETAKGLSALLVGTQSRRSAPNLSMEDPSSNSQETTGIPTELTTDLTLPDSPSIQLRSNNSSFRQNPEVPLSISQFTTPVKPRETSTRRNTPDKPIAALRPAAGTSNTPSPLLAGTRTLSRDNSGVYNHATVPVALPQDTVHFAMGGEGVQMPPPPQYSGSVVPPTAVLPQYTSTECLSPPQYTEYTNRSMTPTLKSTSSVGPAAVCDKTVPTTAALGGSNPLARKTSSNSSTGGDDLDEGEHTPMVPIAKSRAVRVISKQSNV